MFNKNNVFITVNEEVSSIIQQYIIREIKKVLDKYKSITTEEIKLNWKTKYIEIFNLKYKNTMTKRVYFTNKMLLRIQRTQ